MQGTNTMANVIPGGNTLGLGFNLFGEPDPTSTTRRLFEMGDTSGEYTLGSVKYALPANALPTQAGASEIKARTYLSANEFTREFKAEAKVSGKINAFKGSASAKYSRLTKGKNNTLLVEVSNFNPVFQLSLKARSPDKLAGRSYTTSSKKSAGFVFCCYKRGVLFAFFRRYGTHYISKVTVGGELSYYCAGDKSYSQDTQKIEAQATLSMLRAVLFRSQMPRQRMGRF
jgi:MAC/Perforin domain